MSSKPAALEPGTIAGGWSGSVDTHASVSSRAEHGTLAHLTLAMTYRGCTNVHQAIFGRDVLAEALRRALYDEPQLDDVVGTWPDRGRILLELETADTPHEPGLVRVAMKALGPDKFSTAGYGSGLFRRADLASLLAACIA